MSAEGTLRIAVEQIGAEDAAVALERVDEAMRDVSTQAARAGTSTRGALEPAANSARDFERALRGATGQGGPLARAPAQFALFGDSAKRSGREIGMLVNSVSEMGYTALTAIPQFRMLGMSLAMAGGSAVTMGAALGPIGIAIALLGNLLPSVIALFNDEAEAIDDVGMAADETTRFMTALERQSVSAAAAIRSAITQIEDAIEAERLLERLRLGQGSAVEQEAYLRQVQDGYKAAGENLKTFLDGLGLSQQQVDAMRAAILEGSLDRRRALLSALEEDERETALAFNRTFTVLEREIAQRQALVGAGELNDAEGSAAEGNKEKNAAITAARPSRRRRDREPTLEELMNRASGRGDLSQLREFDLDETANVANDEMFALFGTITDLGQALRELAEADVAWAEASDIVQDAQLKRVEVLKEENNELGKTRGNLEELASALQNWSDLGTTSLDEMRMAWNDLRDAQDAAGKSMVTQGELMRATAKSVAMEVADSIGGDMRSAFDSAMDSIIDGSKTGKEAFQDFVKSVVANLVKRSVVEAAVNIASAVAAAARYDFAAAAQHGVAAALWAAVGGVAAGVGFGTGILGGGGPKEERREAPTAQLSEDRDRGGPQNIVVNVGTFPLSTQADIGRAVQDALDAAARRG